MDTVTVSDLTIEVTKGSTLVSVSDEQCVWWTTRTEWDRVMGLLDAKSYDDSEGEGRWRCYEDVCQLQKAVWGVGDCSLPGPGKCGEGPALCEDEPCLSCGCLPVFRECATDGCTAWGYVTDCGHKDQPRPLAGNGVNGGETSCDDCEGR